MPCDRQFRLETLNPDNKIVIPGGELDADNIRSQWIQLPRQRILAAPPVSTRSSTRR